jgi:hypothetical protein
MVGLCQYGMVVPYLPPYSDREKILWFACVDVSRALASRGEDPVSIIIVTIRVRSTIPTLVAHVHGTTRQNEQPRKVINSARAHKKQWPC